MNKTVHAKKNQLPVRLATVISSRSLLYCAVCGIPAGVDRFLRFYRLRAVCVHIKYTYCIIAHR